MNTGRNSKQHSAPVTSIAAAAPHSCKTRVSAATTTTPPRRCQQEGVVVMAAALLGGSLGYTSHSTSRQCRLHWCFMSPFSPFSAGKVTPAWLSEVKLKVFVVAEIFDVIFCVASPSDSVGAPGLGQAANVLRLQRAGTCENHWNAQEPFHKAALGPRRIAQEPVHGAALCLRESPQR